MKAGLVAFVLTVAASSSAFAQVSITGPVTTISFDGFTAAGFAPAPAEGQLDSDSLRTTGLSDGDCGFGATCAADDHARGASPGGVATGGVYAFAVPSGAPALGFQATSDDLTPGTVVVRFSNDTGAAITGASIEYTFWAWNDQDASTTVAVAWSTDDTTYLELGALSAATPPAMTGAAWASTQLRTSVTGLDLAAGASFYLRFSTTDAPDSSGPRDEVALDDVTLRLGCGNGIMEGAEACDDWNTDSGDGCAGDCSLAEVGWTCEGSQPTVCADIDECATGADDCLPNSTCDNQEGGFTCPCDAGYQGDGQTACVDIDECDLGAHDCGDVASCQNTDGGFTCACDNGYDFDGDVCVDIDECAEELAVCDPNARCENTDGGFQCVCEEGFEGDGLSCTEVGGDGDGDGEPPPRADDSGCGCRSASGSSLMTTLLALAFALLVPTGTRGGRRDLRGCSRCSQEDPGCRLPAPGRRRPG